MKLTKTVEPSDYELIVPQVEMLNHTLALMQGLNVRIDLGHHHRLWEYGMAIKAIQELSATDVILEIGSGLGLLGPTLVNCLRKTVIEVEPEGWVGPYRAKCIDELQKLESGGSLRWVHSRLEDFSREVMFKVVCCISVIEHVAADESFLIDLASRVSAGGLLFITTDVVPSMPGNYTYDNLRARNYTVAAVHQMIQRLSDLGFEPFGEVDLEYKGNQVFDYSFCSLAMVKK